MYHANVCKFEKKKVLLPEESINGPVNNRCTIYNLHNMAIEACT